MRTKYRQRKKKQNKRNLPSTSQNWHVPEIQWGPGRWHDSRPFYLRFRNRWNHWLGTVRYLLLTETTRALWFLGISKHFAGLCSMTAGRKSAFSSEKNLSHEGRSNVPKRFRGNDKMYLKQNKKPIEQGQSCVFSYGHDAQPCSSSFSNSQKPKRKSPKTYRSGCRRNELWHMRLPQV